MGTPTEPRIWGDEALFAAEIRRQRKQETAITDRFIRTVLALITFGVTEILLAVHNQIGTTQ